MKVRSRTRLASVGLPSPAFVALSVAAVLFAGCGGAAGPPAGPSSSAAKPSATSGAASAKPAASLPIDRVAVVKAYFDATNRGDVDGAFATFGPGAIFSANAPADPCYRAKPCSNPDGIREQIQDNVAIHTCQVAQEASAAGAIVSGRVATTVDSMRANGVERILGSFMAVVPIDKISFLAVVGDVADPQTALNLAINAGTQPKRSPIPLTPCGAA